MRGADDKNQSKPAFSVLPGEYAIVRLSPAEPIPNWAGSKGFFSVTRTDDELSVVCASSVVPDRARSESGWALLKLRGPFPFDLVGVLHAFLRPLAAAGVSIIAICTFDTDYVLVKKDRLSDAVSALGAAGYENVALGESRGET